ncbi:MAG: sulfite exporter TauE/SafE family protein [Limnobacter sp.]|nr:sulfite exporter TauE/SafE family protein [Limnobacter sp.]
MTWLLLPDLIVILTLGFGLGFFGGLFGIGGGLLAVPLFVLGFGMDQATAQGTALVLMVPNLISGWLKYQQKISVPWQVVAILASTATVTTFLMAKVALLLDPQTLQILFNGFLLLAGLRLFWQTREKKELQSEPLRLAKLPFVGLAGGSSMGLLGMGGGLVATPLLTLWLKQRQITAQSLSLALVTPCSVVALTTYANAHKVDWSLGLPLALGGLASVSLGVGLAAYLPDTLMKRLFAGLLSLTGFVLLVHALN